MKKIEGKYEVVIPNMNPMMDRKIKEAIAKAIRENVDANAVVNYDPNNMTMMTDFYELTMGQVNHKFGRMFCSFLPSFFSLKNKWLINIFFSNVLYLLQNG